MILSLNYFVFLYKNKYYEFLHKAVGKDNITFISHIFFKSQLQHHL
jgi:hypothetical protein